MTWGTRKSVTRRPEDLVITRRFTAPRESVFEAWTRADRVSRWFAPRPLTMPSCEVDFRPGGVLRFVMQAPDGREYRFEGAFRQIVAPERIVFSGTLPGGQEAMTTIVVADHDGETMLTLHQTYRFASEATREAELGWTTTLNQLGEHLEREAPL